MVAQGRSGIVVAVFVLLSLQALGVPSMAVTMNTTGSGSDMGHSLGPEAVTQLQAVVVSHLISV